MVCSSVANLGGNVDKFKKAQQEEKTEKTAETDSEQIKFVSPYDLQKTHSQTLNKKDMADLINDIRINGIKEPIKYVEYNGEKYIVNGHHRVLASKRLGIKTIPIQEVKLPYASYKTIEDLLWID